MSMNWFNTSNNQAKDMNPLFLMYINQIDTNQDGQISAEEIQAFQDSNPDVDSSIFGEILSASNNAGATSQNTEISVSDSFEKSSYVNVESMQGMDFKAFSQLSNTQGDSESANNFWKGLSEFDLNKLFGFMDSGNDGVLSADEINAFASIDGNIENLSLFDLQNIIDGFDANQIAAESVIEPQKNISSRSRGSKDGNYNGDNTPKVDIKTQLTNNLNTAKNAFSNAKANYEAVLDGNINDSALNAKKGEMDDAYNAWQAELTKQNPTLSQNIATANEDIQAVNKQLAQNEKDIFNNEVNLSNWTTAYEVAQEHTLNLTNKKSSLEAAKAGLDSTNETEAKKISKYDSQIRKIEADIVKAKNTEESAKSAKEKAQKALNDSKLEKTTLEGELTKKEAILADYMAQSSQMGENNPVLAQLQSDYEKKKNAYETALNEYKENLKNEVLSKNNDVNSNQKALSEYTNNQALKEYDKGLLCYDENFADVFSKYLLAGASDSSKSDCGGAVRRALYNTMKELYPEAAYLFEEGYGVIGADWDNQYMKDSPFFVDITQMYSSSEIEKMIANGELKGAVINYEKYSGGKSGHVEGVTTKGLTSDYTRPFDYFRSGSNLGQADYNVYLPVTPTAEEIEEYIQTMMSRMSSYDSPIL